MRKYIENIIGKEIPDSDWGLLSEIIEQEELPKGLLLLKEGQTCKHIWYLKEGAVRFFENVNGEYRTTHFFVAPSMFTVYHSLITGAPSELNIEATRDLIMQTLPYYGRLRTLRVPGIESARSVSAISIKRYCHVHWHHSCFSEQTQKISFRQKITNLSFDKCKQDFISELCLKENQIWKNKSF